MSLSWVLVLFKKMIWAFTIFYCGMKLEREREREREALNNKLKRHMYERMHMHTTQLDLKEKAFQLQAPALHMFVNKIC